MDCLVKSANYILTLSESDNLQQAQDKIVNTILEISSEINCQKITTNSQIGAALADSSEHVPNPIDLTLNISMLAYLMGRIRDVEIYVDPNMRWIDTNILWSNGVTLQVILNDSQMIT